MPVDNQAKHHIHELVEQLGPAQIGAVLQLLEVTVEPEEEPLSEEDTQAVAASREYVRQSSVFWRMPSEVRAIRNQSLSVF